MDKKVIICTGLAVLALFGGALGQRYFKPVEEQSAADVEQPEVALASDPFSLRLFQLALKEKTRGNVLVAPHAVSECLLSLQSVAGGKTLEELMALDLKPQKILRGCEPRMFSLLAMDFNLQRTEAQVAAMPLPFSEDVPKAISLYNGMAAATLRQNAYQLADSKLVSTRTRLLAGCATCLQHDWELPFNSANSRTANFDNISGGMPYFHQMRSKAQYRFARTDSCKAVAIPFKSDDPSRPPLFYIGILPSGSAREYAAALTAEQLTELRRTLADAVPQETLVEIPRMELQVLPYDMRDTLRRIGLKSLFDSESADFSPLTPERIHLGAFIHACSISIIESQFPPLADDTLDDARECVSFNRPYIWLIADLATGTPPAYIGLVEEM